MIQFEVEISKGIPTKQIQTFEDKTVYNMALYTREYTKGAKAFPYLSGRLQNTEISLPIQGSGMNYGLGAGVNYATAVWNYKNVNWTNPSTQNQWYYSVFRKQCNSIVSSAINKALKEI